jgi:hypothetical protein
MEKQKVIKYIKIGALIGVSILIVRFIIKKVRLNKLKNQFGDYGTLIDDNKGNSGGFTQPEDNTTNDWSPRFSAETLRDAMKGWGYTDEDTIWNVLENLNETQIKAVRIYFDTYFGDGETLFEWFEGDLSGSDLIRAKSYFK